MSPNPPVNVARAGAASNPDEKSGCEWLSAIVDCLLPGDNQHWPAASALGLSARVASHLRQSEDGEQMLTQLFQLTQPSFEDLTQAQRIKHLEHLEQTESTLFERLLTASYNMYYTEPVVRQVIERLTGYAARPPQPKGYSLEPFDESLLNKVRQRDPFWRQENDT